MAAKFDLAPVVPADAKALAGRQLEIREHENVPVVQWIERFPAEEEVGRSNRPRDTGGSRLSEAKGSTESTVLPGALKISFFRDKN